jgi:hypothetical protein
MRGWDARARRRHGPWLRRRRWCKSKRKRHGRSRNEKPLPFTLTRGSGPGKHERDPFATRSGSRVPGRDLRTCERSCAPRRELAPCRCRSTHTAESASASWCRTCTTGATPCTVASKERALRSGSRTRLGHRAGVVIHPPESVLHGAHVMRVDALALARETLGQAAVGSRCSAREGISKGHRAALRRLGHGIASVLGRDDSQLRERVSQLGRRAGGWHLCTGSLRHEGVPNGSVRARLGVGPRLRGTGNHGLRLRAEGFPESSVARVRGRPHGGSAQCSPQHQAREKHRGPSHMQHECHAANHAKAAG